MGESIMGASSEEAKMGKTGAANPTLEVSVSFGRFENDSLSWEKWSSFSPNKYLEEVEKCATPGSVAMKKAYFEAHYKKIAARKAELQDQANQMGEDYVSQRSDERNGGDLIGKTSRTDTESNVLFSQTSAEAVSHKPKLEEEQKDGPINNDDAPSYDFGQESAAGQAKVEEESKVDKALLSNLEEAASLNRVVAPSIGSEDMEELPKELKEEKKLEESIPVEKVEALSLEQDSKELPKKMVKEVKTISLLKKDAVKSGHPKVSQKTVPMSKVREVAGAKKKPSSPSYKNSQISTPKVSKPVPSSVALSASRSSRKKITSSSLPRNKTPATIGSGHAAVKSLHMSLSFDMPASNPSPLSTNRNSLIMEKMKDKDIIKRAFKTFQSNLSQSSEVRATIVEQTPPKGVQAKASTTAAPRKENGGSRTLGGIEKRTAKAPPSSVNAERDERPERRREPLYFGTPKKLQEKSISKKAESAKPQAKTKERQETEIKKLRQSLNFKATPMPGHYRANKVTKSPLDKEGSKTFGL